MLGKPSLTYLYVRIFSKLAAKTVKNAFSSLIVL